MRRVLAPAAAALLLLLAAAAADPGPYDGASCAVPAHATTLLEWDWADKETFALRPSEAGVGLVAALEGDIAVVSVMGKARTGKSTLLNALVAEALRRRGLPPPATPPFAVGALSKPVTEEVDALVLPPCATGSDLTVLLLDSPGVDAYNRHGVFDSQLLTLLSMLSSLAMDNIFGMLDRAGVETVYDSITTAQQLNLFSSGDPDAIGRTRLLFVMQQLKVDLVDPETGAAVESAAWVQRVLDAMDGVNEAAHYGATLNDFFSAIDAVSLRNPSEAGYADDISALYDRVFGGDLEPKRLQGAQIDGEMLATLLRQWVELVNVPRSAEGADGESVAETLLDRVRGAEIARLIGEYDAVAELRLQQLPLPVADAELVALNGELAAAGLERAKRFGMEAAFQAEADARLGDVRARNGEAAMRAARDAHGACLREFEAAVAAAGLPVAETALMEMQAAALAACEVPSPAREALTPADAGAVDTELRSEMSRVVLAAAAASADAEQRAAAAALSAAAAALVAPDSALLGCLRSVGDAADPEPCVAAVRAELEALGGGVGGSDLDALLAPAQELAQRVRDVAQQRREAREAGARARAAAIKTAWAQFCAFDEAATPPAAIDACRDAALAALARVEQLPEVTAATNDVRLAAADQQVANRARFDAACAEHVARYRDALLDFHAQPLSWFVRRAYQPPRFDDDVKCLQVDAAPHVAHHLRAPDAQAALGARLAAKLAAMQLLLLLGYGTACVGVGAFCGVVRVTATTPLLAVSLLGFVQLWAPVAVVDLRLHYAAVCALVVVAGHAFMRNPAAALDNPLALTPVSGGGEEPPSLPRHGSRQDVAAAKMRHAL